MKCITNLVWLWHPRGSFINQVMNVRNRPIPKREMAETLERKARERGGRLRRERGGRLRRERGNRLRVSILLDFIFLIFVVILNLDGLRFVYFPFISIS